VTWDHWLDDYKQIRPGWWFPMTHGYNVDERDENGDHFIASTRSITVKDVKVDEPLDDELFVMEFKEGIDVNDDRFGGFITYKWKNDRTEAEWEQLRQKAQQRLEEDNAEKRALDERIGQIAPEFSKDGKWLNTEPLSMRDLRGKAVIFQFWGVWCGPCHNYMGLLSTRPQDDPIVVIGVHTPEDDLDGIKEDMDKYQADGPVYVDVGEGWGQLNDWYRVKRRPYWITIRPDGKVLGHFDNPRWALQAAQKSLPESGEEK
jgi:thiol-disulfide isomerase/thioredoxin